MPPDCARRLMITLDPFRNDFSSSAFVNIRTADGIEHHLIGKFIDVEVLGVDSNQTYDLWMVRPDREPIGTGKLNNLIRSIQMLPEYEQAGKPKIIRLDGEAWIHTTSTSLVRGIGFIAGIRRRKRLSEAAIKANTARLEKYRAGTAA